MITPEVSRLAHKKAKRKLERLEEPPACVDLDAPVEKKRKKKAKEKEAELNLRPADQLMPSPEKKKKREKEEFNLHPPDELTLSPKKKKKKKKRANEEEEKEEFNLHPANELMLNPEKKKKKKKLECLKNPPVPVNINTPEKKKKARTAEEEELNLHPAEEPPQSSERRKKKKKKTEECVIDLTSHGEKKKKKKKQASVTMETLSPNHQEAAVSTETEVTATKLKKNDGGKKEKKIKKPEKTSSSNDDENRIRLASLDWDRVEELEGYIPGVKKRPVVAIKQMLRDDLSRFRVFKQQGIALRRGRFSMEENRRIITNVSDFLALTGIESAIELFPQLSRDRNIVINKMRRKYHFQIKLAEGIARPVTVVYIRAVKLLDDINRVGMFSREEVDCLKKLQRIHGNNWSTISKKMDRSGLSLEKRFSTLDSNHGHWTVEEELRLKRAVNDYFETLIQEGPPGSGLSRDQLCNNLPWKPISLKVQTRSWVQCRKKWFTILKNRLTTNGPVFNRRADGSQAKICLIETLYDMCVEDPADIDWDEVANVIGNVTPICVQRAFNRLKVNKVPNWTRLSYDEIISFLKLHEVPQLKSRIKSETRWAERREQYGEERYDLAQIFIPGELDSG